MSDAILTPLMLTTSGCFDCDWWRSGSTAAAGWKKAQQARRRSWCSVPAACTNCSIGAVIIHGVPKRMVAWGLNMWHPVDCMRLAHRPAGPIDPDLWPHVWKWIDLNLFWIARGLQEAPIYFFKCIILATISWTCLAYQSWPSPQKRLPPLAAQADRNGTAGPGPAAYAPDHSARSSKGWWAPESYHDHHERPTTTSVIW